MIKMTKAKPTKAGNYLWLVAQDRPVTVIVFNTDEEAVVNSEWMVGWWARIDKSDLVLEDDVNRGIEPTDYSQTIMFSKYEPDDGKRTRFLRATP